MQCVIPFFGSSWGSDPPSEFRENARRNALQIIMYSCFFACVRLPQGPRFEPTESATKLGQRLFLLMLCYKFSNLFFFIRFVFVVHLLECIVHYNAFRLFGPSCLASWAFCCPSRKHLTPWHQHLAPASFLRIVALPPSKTSCTCLFSAHPRHPFRKEMLDIYSACGK